MFSIIAIDDLPKDKIPTAVIERALNKNQSETSGLARLLDIKKYARVMLTSNIDIADRLTNGQIGTVVKIVTDRLSRVVKVYVQFDDAKAGENLKKKDAYSQRNNCIPIEKVEATIRVYPNAEFPTIKRTQFPLILSWACTIHKVQGLTLQKAVISFDLARQRNFNPGQIYVALSRVTSLNGLYLTGQFKENLIKADPKATEEYTILKEQYSLEVPKYYNILPINTLIITLLNARSLLKHACDIAADSTLVQSDLICITETQISESSDVSCVTENLNQFQPIFNNHNNDKFCSLANLYRDTIQIEENFVKLTKQTFLEKGIKILLLYKKCSVNSNGFHRTLRILVESREIDIILGDFNMNALKKGQIHYLSSYTMIVNNPLILAVHSLIMFTLKSPYWRNLTLTV